MNLWRKLTQAKPGDAPWRKRKAERFGGATVRCELGEVTDVSATGMRVMASGKPPVKPGGVLALRIRFGDGALQLQAQVRWVRRRGLKRHEMGLHFVQVKPGMAKVLEAIARFGMASAAKHMEDTPMDDHDQTQSRQQAQTQQQQQAEAPRPPAVETCLPNYYRILGVGPEATDAEIKARFRKLAVSCHPDRSDAPDAKERFEAINEAYHVLSDPQRREAYYRMVG